MKHLPILVLAGILILSAFFAGCTQQAAAPAQALKIGVVSFHVRPFEFNWQRDVAVGTACGR